MVGKYPCATEIQKIQIVAHIFSGFDREQDAFFIPVQGIFVGIIIKASAASLKVTDLSFAFTFRLDGCLLFVNFD